MKYDNVTLWTALITPFTESDNTLKLEVDFDSLTRLVREQEEAQNGLLILGSTGEALNIDLATKQAIIKHVITLKPKVPVMAGVGGHDLSQTLDWVRWLETQELDCYLMVVPMYAKPGPKGQTLWFKALMDTVKRPVMLYNVPGRTGKELELETVKELKDHKNFWAIKEASGSVEKFKAYLQACGNKQVYCGDDGLFPEFANAGSCGLVSVASNPWPKQTHLYVRQCLEKSFDAKDLWERAANSLFCASNPVPAKRLIKLEGRIKSDILMPPLTQSDLRDETPVVEANKAINAWYEEQL